MGESGPTRAAGEGAWLGRCQSIYNTKDSLGTYWKRDRFIEGPLSDPGLADPGLVDRYVQLTYGYAKDSPGGENNAESEDEDEVAHSELPGSEALRRGANRLALFDYQDDLASQLVSIATEPPPKNIALLSLPTGAGKTRTALAGIIQMLQAQAIKRVLWLAPSRELLDQAFIGLRLAWERSPAAPDLVAFRCHELKEFPIVEEPAIYFSTPQMLVKRVSHRLRRLPAFDFLLFDEAHHAVAPKFMDAMNRIRTVGGSLIPAVGLSATPGRSGEEETESLVRLFNKRLLTSKLLFPNALIKLQDRGILAKLEFRKIELPSKLVGRVHVVESASQLSGPIRNLEVDPSRFKAILKTVSEIGEDNRVLVFCGSISHANAVGLVLSRLGHETGIVTSRTPLIERSNLLSAFAKGELSVLVNKSVLATGYDCPAVSHVILTMPIGSPILFEQIVGRVSRGPKIGGSEIGTIWQIDNNLAIHGRPASYHRYRDYEWY